MVIINWNTCISTWLYPLVLPIESITWAHREWGRQRFIEGDLFAHVWPQQPNQAMQSKTNTALQNNSKFFEIHCEHWALLCCSTGGGQGGGRAEGQLRGEYGWAGRSRAGRQGRAQPGFSGILFPMCILYTLFRLVHLRMVLLLWMTGSGWGDSQTLELQLSARGKADQGFSLFRTLFDVNVQTATV